MQGKQSTVELLRYEKIQKFKTGVSVASQKGRVSPKVFFNKII